MLKLHETPEIDFFSADTSLILDLPFVSGGISAGFPSPADDYLEDTIDLNKEIIKNPSSTFYGRVKGVSMIDIGIFPNDILVIDKSLELHNNDIVISYIEGEFTLKRIRKDKTGVWLIPESSHYKPIQITEDMQFLVWGVVTYVIKSMRR